MFHPSMFQNSENFKDVKKDREILVDKKTRSDYPLTSMEHFSTPYKSILESVQELTPFSRLFFSAENVKLVQSNIRYSVYNASNKKFIISNQDETNLIIVMRAIYLQHSLNPDKEEDYLKEISRLDNLVLEKVVPDIISEIKQYKGYLKDIEKNPEPISLPKNVNITGTKGDQSRGISDVLGINTLG